MLRLRGDRHLLGDRPHEGEHLARDGGDDDVGVLAAGDQPAVALAQPHLRLPGDVLGDLRELLDALAGCAPKSSPDSDRPRRLRPARAARVAVAGLRDAAEPALLAAGVLGRDQPDERGELARVVEAREVAELGDDGDGDVPLHAAQRLQRLDDRAEPPRRRELDEFVLEARDTLDLLVDGAQRFLEDDLLRRGRADDLRQIAQVRVVPVGPARVVEARAAAERTSAEASRP